MKRILSIAMFALLAVMVSACGSIPRPTPPVAGESLAHPWGSVSFSAAEGEIEKSSTDNFIKSLKAKRERHRKAGSADGRYAAIGHNLTW
jgi:hypothetical protein